MCALLLYTDMEMQNVKGISVHIIVFGEWSPAGSDARVYKIDELDSSPSKCFSSINGINRLSSHVSISKSHKLVISMFHKLIISMSHKLIIHGMTFSSGKDADIDCYVLKGVNDT